MYERVTGEEHLYRDLNSNAIVNTDIARYNEIKRRAREKNEINNLKKDVSEIKNLLKELIDKKD
mgnify:CR=1 FL=1|tara:strand:+ start:1741 stop:1932 length:192 start_codon:yes stop_codon:yes gene_type:complete